MRYGYIFVIFVGGGIAIAPPPSLIESSASPPPAVAGGGGAGGLTAPTGMNFAQKLMAKYGYKVRFFFSLYKPMRIICEVL